MEGYDETVTKHEQLLRYIEELRIGSKISVRKLAKETGVSEGTAYRAVKEAENLGIVITKERIGTVRVEKRPRGMSGQLTFADVVQIVEGHVLGGSEGLDQPLHKYVIGAMREEAMARYIDPGSLLIVGNRDNAHSLALKQGAGVLITGGFGTTRDVKLLADRLGLPLISSRHDTFTVASMINRAIFDRLIKKKIMLIEDITAHKPKLHTLKSGSTVGQFERLVQAAGEYRFAVVDEWNRLVGIVSRADVEGLVPEQTIDKVVIRNPVTVSPQTSLASAAQIMTREGIHYLPVVDRSRKLVGAVTRREVLDALRSAHKQPQLGETFDHLIWNGFVEERGEGGELMFRGFIIPQMATNLGTISEGVLIDIMTQAAYRTARDVTGSDHVLDNITTYFIKPVQIEDSVLIRSAILETNRRLCRLEIEILRDSSLVCKGMMTMQSIDPG